MAEKTKDTIYIDIDDEITSIVDRVQNSGSKIVALVLPKRAAVLQSIVNMKLLKRSADDANKQVVLITSEAGLLPLAGATGVYVAKNLQSKPEVPEPPDKPLADDEEVVEDMGDDAEDSKLGVIAGAAAVGAVAGAKKGDKSINATTASAKPPKSSKSGSKTPKIPNFERFRKKTFIAIGVVILLIIAWYLAVFVAPSAKIVIETDTQAVPTEFDFIANTNAESVSVDGKIVPAQFESTDVDESASANATGTKDVGTKAKGTVTIRNCDENDNVAVIKAGTGVSSAGKTFITQGSLSLGTANFDGSGDCKTSGSHVGSVQVVAQENGDSYNLSSGATYSVSGFSSSVTGTGSAMTGGTSKTVKIVTQSDVDSAKDKLEIDDNKIKSELKTALEDAGYFAIEDTFEKQDENTTTTPNTGEEGSEVTVKYTAKFVMVGVKKDDLKQVIEDSIKDEVDTEKQAVQNDGIDSATYEIVKSGDDTMTIIFNGTPEVGPDINVDQLKTDIKGKKSGETENIVMSYPVVNTVKVDYSPFWVNKTPNKESKINIEFVSATSEQ